MLVHDLGKEFKSSRQRGEDEWCKKWISPIIHNTLVELNGWQRKAEFDDECH